MSKQPSRDAPTAEKVAEEHECASSDDKPVPSSSGIKVNAGPSGTGPTATDNPPAEPAFLGAEKICKPAGPSKDIGSSWPNRRQLSDKDKFELLTNHWKPDRFYTFPSHKEHGKSRSFQSSWLQKYHGLAFSPILGGGVCIYCFLFAPSIEGLLVSSAFTSNYRKASTILGEHFVGKDGRGKGYHFSALQAAENFIRVMEGVQEPVMNQLAREVQARVEANRHKLKSIIKTVIFCGKQNIPLRGHRDDSIHLQVADNNPGNFQKLLEFRIDAGDTALSDHFQTAHKRATYRSKTTQNELVDICGQFIQNTLLSEIREAKFYSIAADEVTDQANHEQLSLTLRFVDAQDNIRTEFMGFLYCESTSGEFIANRIMDKLDEWGIPLENCRGQTYDGAGNMSGAQRGTAARISGRNNKAIYTHCSSHKLNLAVVKALTVPGVRNMMDTADKIVRFYAFSPKRQLNLESWIEQVHEEDQARVKKLQSMCKTRWVQRHDALNIFVELHEAIANSLEDISTNRNDWNAASVMDARSFLAAITDFHFIASLQITRDILAYVHPISISLQSNTQDVMKAMTEVQNVIQALQEQRDNVDDFHTRIYGAMVAMADSVNVQPTAPRRVNRQRHRANAPAGTVEEYYKRNVTIPVLDELIAALNDRFGPTQRQYADAMNIIPTVIQRENRADTEAAIQRFANLHRDDLPNPQNIEAEIHIWVNRWTGEGVVDPPNTAGQTIKAIDQAFFPNLHVLAKLLCTTGVTSCECERSFSALRRLETYLRTTMSEVRINGLALMHVHYGVQIDLDWVGTEFAQRNPRRMKLINILAE